MKKMLYIGDPAANSLISQAVPIIKLLSQEYLIDVFCPSPVVMRLCDHMPFVNEPICICKEDEKINIISKQKAYGMSCLRYFLIGGDYDNDELFLSKELIEKLESYDKILILYDNNLYHISLMINLIYEKFKNKCFGRTNKWNKDLKPLDVNKYIPKETVEALGFQWDDNLLHLDFEWYKNFDTKINYGKNSVAVTCYCTCESKIPYLHEESFYQASKLGNFLRKEGLDVYPTRKTAEPLEQIFNSKCNYALFVNSITLWTSKAFQTKHPVCFSPLTELQQIQYDTKRIIPNDINNLHDLSAELVVKLFLKEINFKKLYI